MTSIDVTNFANRMYRKTTKTGKHKGILGVASLSFDRATCSGRISV